MSAVNLKITQKTGNCRIKVNVDFVPNPDFQEIHDYVNGFMGKIYEAMYSGKVEVGEICDYLEEVKKEFEERFSLPKTEEVNNDLTVEVDIQPTENANNMTSEEYVEKIVSKSLEKINKFGLIEEQVDIFLKDIDFPMEERIVKEAFIASCKVKKVRYDEILLEMQKVFPKLKYDIIKSILREEFNVWLIPYPKVKEKFPQISIMSLLKVFSKAMKK